MKTYILTIPVRGTQTVLVQASSAREAREKYEAGRGEFQRTDLSIDWTGVPRIILDGGWLKKRTNPKPKGERK